MGSEQYAAAVKGDSPAGLKVFFESKLAMPIFGVRLQVRTASSNGVIQQNVGACVIIIKVSQRRQYTVSIGDALKQGQSVSLIAEFTNQAMRAGGSLMGRCCLGSLGEIDVSPFLEVVRRADLLTGNSG